MAANVLVGLLTVFVLSISILSLLIKYCSTGMSLVKMAWMLIKGCWYLWLS